MKNLLIYSLLFLFSIPLWAQTSYKNAPSSSKMSILGTSTLHDWESTVDDVTVTATVKDKRLLDIQMTARVESIKSGKNGMDKNTYKAMKSDEFPSIRFSASELSVEGTTLKGNGTLTIAGQSKSIPVAFNYESWEEESFLVIGQVELVMSEYGIEPPKAMMGAIKTGDEITIKFEIPMLEQ